VTATITPRPITFSFTADDKEYDGTNVATVQDFVFPGIVAGDALGVADVTAHFAESKAGVWIVTIDDGFTVTGNDDGNYRLTAAVDVEAEITPRLITVGFIADDKEYDGTTDATVTLLDFTAQLAPADQGTMTVTVQQAAFEAPDPGLRLVTILESTITGNDDGNYEVNFADDVEAEIRHNIQIIPSGWSMTVMSLDNLTDESVAAWVNLGVTAFKDSTMQIQRGRQPGYGEAFWVFNRDNEVIALQGQKRFDQPAWTPPFADDAWVMTGPPAGDYVVPEGMQVWTWNGSVSVLIPPGEKLSAGSAAWFWQ